MKIIINEGMSDIGSRAAIVLSGGVRAIAYLRYFDPVGASERKWNHFWGGDVGECYAALQKRPVMYCIGRPGDH